MSRDHADSGGESKGVVYAALGGNLCIAIIKFVAFAMTRSSAMLTEAVHSLVDTIDQVLLLIGEHRAERPADDRHPFGHGLEIYFWSFTVALMVFLAGGAVSVYEGVQRLLHAGEIETPWINALVLGLSFLFEGGSFLVGVRAARKVMARRAGGERVSLFRFVRRSKDPNLFTTLVEDGAALTGLVIAAAGLAGGVLLHVKWADGLASILIGLLLMAMALVLANETRSLVAGEAADEAVLKRLQAVLDAETDLCRQTDLATLHFGPKAILVAVTGEFFNAAPMDSVARRLTEKLQAADDRVMRVYFRPRPAPSPPAVASPADGAA